MRVMLTRPADQAARSAQLLREMGHEVILAPLLVVAPLDAPPPAHLPPDLLVLTSANAVDAAALLPWFTALKPAPVLAVGARTAARARLAGFADVRSVDGDAQDVAAALARLPAGTHVLDLGGRDRAADLANRLAGSGLRIETVAVYAAEAVQTFDAATVTALRDGKVDAVLHYSARTAETFLACLRAAGLEAAASGLLHGCLSAAIADRLGAAGLHHLAVAAEPQEEALLAALAAATP
jgi:uroporphyrinogen-III synthase